MMWWNNDWPMPHWMVFGPMLMFILVVLCFAMMLFMMSGGMRHRRHGGYAIEILKERYARGEIDQAEFEQRRRFLEA